MSDPFVGEIRMVGFNFAPVGWAFCNGATISITQQQALFALLGTTYGGNGTSTFQLPNLQGRSPVGMGNGIGLTPIQIGQVAGTENVSLTINNLPSHTHVASVSGPTAVTGQISIPATSSSAGEGATPGPTTVLGPCSAGGRPANLYSTSAANTNLAAFNVSLQGGTPNIQNSLTGSSQPVPIRNPYLGINFIIAMNGIYPTRQ